MRNLLTFLLVIIIINSCGFHLKGKNIYYRNLPFTDWNIEGASELKNYLKYELLKDNNVYISTSTNKVAIIKLIEFNKTKQLQSINRLGTVDDYFLCLDVLVEVVYDDKNFGEPIKLRLGRNISFNNNNIIGKLEEEESIWREIYKEASEQIINRIRYLYR